MQVISKTNLINQQLSTPYHSSALQLYHKRNKPKICIDKI